MKFCIYRDGQTPLHLACAWGMELVVQCLMEHSADVNTQVTLLNQLMPGAQWLSVRVTSSRLTGGTVLEKDTLSSA